MNTEQHGMKHGSTTDRIIGVFWDVYKELGYGFLEGVYEHAMFIALRQSGLDVVRQAPISVRFRGELVGEYRADLVVQRVVLVELKATAGIDPAHEAQVLNYLRATDLEVGLLLNFGPKGQIKRYVFDNNRKPNAPSSS